MNAKLEQIVKALPDKTGVYIMKDSEEKIIYVGKAKNISSRVAQHFKSELLKSIHLKKDVKSVGFIITQNEVEALMLECNFIKNHKPKYNILLKDSKAYPYIKININEDFPELLSIQNPSDSKNLYFGPFKNAKTVRDIIEVLNHEFKLKCCKYKIKSTRARPCLYHLIENCAAPCAARISPESYKKTLKEAIDVLKGNTSGILNQLNLKMNDYSKHLKFEEANNIKEKILSFRELKIVQRMTDFGKEDCDILGFYRIGNQISIHVFNRRSGKINSNYNFKIKSVFLKDSDILGEFIENFYFIKAKLLPPPLILLPFNIPNFELILNLFKKKYNKNVVLEIPKLGKKRSLIDFANQNAEFC